MAFDEDAGTFVTVGDEGRFARVLLGRLVVAGGARGLIAVKVQRDVYRSLGGASVGNREVERRWQREAVRLQRLAGRGAVALTTVGPDACALEPAAFDRRTGRIFRLVSPKSWQPLRTCRDDALLRAARLQPWSNTTMRYLHDPANPGGTFFTWSAPDGAETREGVKVRHRHDLFRDLVASWAALSQEARAEVGQRLPDVAAVLVELAADEVETRLVPVAFHDAPVVVTELQEVHFDEYCDFVAGAPLAAAVPIAAAMGRAVATAGLAARLAGPQQWLTVPCMPGDAAASLADDARQARRFAVEATFLKLQAFVAACRAIAEYHAEFDEPHLGVAAENLMLRAFGGGNSPAPARWCFELVLTDANASLALQLDGRGQKVAEGLCLPALDGGRTWHSPELAEAVGAVELVSRVQATPIVEQGAVVGLRCELPTGKDRLRGLAVGDVVRLQPESPVPGLGEQALLARVTALTRQAAVAEFRPDAADAMVLANAPSAFSATTSCHRRLRPVSDMFSLGMLLSRALLVHDERDLFAVRELWDRLLDRLDVMCAGQTAPDSARVAGALRGLLDAERGQLDSNSVLWPQQLRAAASSPLPPVLWRELLSTIGRLLTNYPGFSWSVLRPAGAAEAPDAPLRRVIAHVEGLLAALRIELTEQNVRREEIADVAEALVAELDAANPPGPVRGGGRS